MKSRHDALDAETKAAWTALKRAARKARELANKTGTPFYVMRKGKIVNLNKVPKQKPAATAIGRSSATISISRA